MYSIKQVAKKSAQLLAEGKKEDALSLVKNFIKLNKLKNQLDLVVDQIGLEYYKLTGELSLDITSAFDLSESQIEEIKHYISAKLKVAQDKLRVNLINDASIIGGFKAKTPIAEVDRSVKTKLNQLKSIN